MKRVRLIALDMDGTLLASDHYTVPKRNIDAIRRAHSLGIRVTINTGRMVEDAGDFIRRLDLPCMIIASNGARAYDAPKPEGKLIYRCELAPQDAHRVLDILLPMGMLVHAFEDGRVNTAGGQPGQRYHLVDRGLIEARYGEENLRAAADRGLLKIFAEGGGFAGSVYNPIVEPARARIKEEMPHLRVTSSGVGNIEITSPEGGKGIALAHMAAHFGLMRENVMAVGDMPNDLNMLEYAYHSVAMGNAAPEVRAACRYETGSNDECGVAQIIERVIAAVSAQD